MLLERATAHGMCGMQVILGCAVMRTRLVENVQQQIGLAHEVDRHSSLFFHSLACRVDCAVVDSEEAQLL